MTKAEFVIYGCPYTAFESTKAVDAFVVPEPDRSLFHLRRNTNRILNLVGFSGVKDIRLVGCSADFVDDFSSLLAEHPEAGFRVTIEQKTHNAFSTIAQGPSHATDIVVTERQPELIPIAHQLAREIGGKLVVVDAASEQEAAAFSEALKDFEEGNGLARQNGLENCCALVRKKLGPGLLAGTYSSVTFITKLPYNLYPFPYPTGHLPAHAASEIATAGFLKANTPRLQAGVAIILDSGKTQANSASEYEDLRESLARSYGILPAHNAAALGDFRYFVEDLPADLMFLTAHCGQMPGMTLEATFAYKGKAGQVRYAVDRGVSAVAKSGLVDCQTHYLPIEVNGVSWKENGCERELFLKFAKVEMDASWGMKPRNPEFGSISITRVVNANPTRFPTKCIECGDEQYFVPLTTTIGGYYFPLVFNNACASYSGVCEEFLPDVSFYVGTTRPVDSFSAVEVARTFVQNLGTMPVGKALFEAQRKFITGYAPYILAGVPWLSVPRYDSRAIGIMNANSIIKAAITSGSGEARSDHRRKVFLEQQRKMLLKQLFNAADHSTAQMFARNS
jgi:hypothetical protein